LQYPHLHKIALSALVWYIPSILTQRINNQITAPELRVIDAEEQNLGVLKLADALKLAKEKGLDLIEISPEAKPPVGKIISFDKFRYQQDKKMKKQRATQKSSEQKQVQISIREAKNDLINKANRVNEFLAEGHRVEIALRLRGREKANRDFARKKIQEFLTIITPNHQVMGPPQTGMYGLNLMVVPKK